MRIQEVIRRPLITEKSTELRDERNIIAFRVDRRANKIEIRRAVEELFDVKVRSVNTMRYRGKWRRVGRNYGKRPSFKKAIVKLAEGERIDVYEGI
jgi:large subunit ribosomal protein L23